MAVIYVQQLLCVSAVKRLKRPVTSLPLTPFVTKQTWRFKPLPESFAVFSRLTFSWFNIVQPVTQPGLKKKKRPQDLYQVTREPHSDPLTVKVGSDLLIRELRTVFFFFLCWDLRLRLCSKEQRPRTLNLPPYVGPPGEKKEGLCSFVYAVPVWRLQRESWPRSGELITS